MEIFNGAIGIDLGTTWSCVCVWNGDHVDVIPNKEGKNTTPSWVAYTETDKLIGDAARAQVARNPENTVYGVKRLMGKNFSSDDVQNDVSRYSYSVTGDLNDMPTINVKYQGVQKSFKPEQISADILGYMKDIAQDYLGKIVKRAVITVPAYFNDTQRKATKNAAIIAGLECDLIINEPTAACLCYGLDKKENSNVLIFDLGGGTFDVSILKISDGIFKVLSTSGNTHLGGEDFDNIIVDNVQSAFCSKYGINDDDISSKSYRKLKTAAEEAKKTLSVAQQATIDIDNFHNGIDLNYRISRSTFELWCDEIFKKCLGPVEQALMDAKISRSDIDEIVLIGGSTRIPRVQQLLSAAFNGKVLNKSVNPDEAVAYGAAIQGAIMSKSDTSGKTKELLLMDVTPLSLGVEANDGIMSVIIPRNSHIPTKRSKIYSTTSDQQTSVEIQIFEGERTFTKENHKIGNFELTDVPLQPRGVPKIEVTFAIDSNGILTVKAIDKNTGNSNQLSITESGRGQLSQEEINRMIDDANKYRVEDEMRRDALNSRHDFERELMFTQQVLNDPMLKRDDKGDNILTENEIDWLNQYIINNLSWLTCNDDLTREKVDEAKRLFMEESKATLRKLFMRKKYIDDRAAATVTSKNEMPLNIQDILDGL